MKNENEVTALVATLEKCREVTGCPEGVDLQDHLRQLAAAPVCSGSTNRTNAQQQSKSDFEIKARLCKESNSLHDRLREAEKRIAELESRTITVKLPPKIERDDADGWFMYNGGRVGGGAAEWYNKALDDVSSAQPTTFTVKLPPLNDDLIAILGRPNFMCAHLAELLRKSGEDIKRKAEHEQAAIIHWFLGIYLEHGDKWEGVAKSDIQARVAGIKWEAE